MFERLGSAEDEKWYRIEFIKLYETLSTSGVDGETCRPLAGLSQATVANGEIVPALPCQITCDPERADFARLMVKHTQANLNIPGSIPAIALQRP